MYRNSQKDGWTPNPKLKVEPLENKDNEEYPWFMTIQTIDRDNKNRLPSNLLPTLKEAKVSFQSGPPRGSPTPTSPTPVRTREERVKEAL